MYTIAELIKNKRNSLKMTQKVLADLCHVTSNAVSRWELGQDFPCISVWSYLANALQIPMSEIAYLAADTGCPVVYTDGKEFDEYTSEHVRTVLTEKPCTLPDTVLSVYIPILYTEKECIYRLQSRTSGNPALSKTDSMSRWMKEHRYNAYYYMDGCYLLSQKEWDIYLYLKETVPELTMTSFLLNIIQKKVK